MAEFEDNWVTKAMADDTLVAIVLLSLSRPYLKVHRSVRQRRSKLYTAVERKAVTKTTSEIATTPQLVEDHCDPSTLVPPQTVDDKVVDEESPVSVANASSQQEEISNQENKFLLPDLNLPAEEEDVNSYGELS